MNDCKILRRDMLRGPIIVREAGDLDFDGAKRIADRKAREFSHDAMLLSWFDKKAGKFSPDVICCDTEKPTWLVYAESRGGSISVDINNEDYVFVYRPGSREV